jgi:Ala-tRNA(Pro) deacylase
MQISVIIEVLLFMPAEGLFSQISRGLDMSIAPTLKNYLMETGVAFDLVPHAPAYTASRIAQSAHVSGNSLAKGVLLNTDHGYMMAVVPASRKVDLSGLSHRLNERLGLASEDEIDMIFDDCDPGAAPACGTAYSMRVIVDKSLDQQDDLYIECGDHENLIHVNKEGFAKLMADAAHAGISRGH